MNGQVMGTAVQAWGLDRATAPPPLPTVETTGGVTTILGGAGLDLVIQEGASCYDATLERVGTADSWSLTVDRYGIVAGTTTPYVTGSSYQSLSGIERLAFTDLNLALDLFSPTDNAGAVLALYHAGFGTLPDPVTFGGWIGVADAWSAVGSPTGSLLEDLARGMLDYYVPGGMADDELVTLLHTNVVGRSPDAAALALYGGQLADGLLTQAQLAALAAGASENLSRYEEDIQQGLVYLPDGRAVEGDDYGAGSVTGGTVAMNGSAVGGAIESAGDADWFRITLAPWSSYQFQVEPAAEGGVGALTLTLRNERGQREGMANGGGEAGSAALTLETRNNLFSGDTWYLVVEGREGATGAYGVTARETGPTDDWAGDATTTGVVGVDGNGGSGVIQWVGDQDWFAVELSAGQSYELACFIGTANPDWILTSATLTLLDRYGNTVTWDGGDESSASPRIEYTPVLSGTYFVAVAGQGEGVGTYTLSVRANDDDHAASTATTGVLSAGGWGVSGRIETAGDHDWFAVTLTAGGSYRFDASPPIGGGTGVSAGLALRDADGTIVVEAAGGGGFASLEYVPQVDGTYYLDVYGVGGSTGIYGLSMDSAGGVGLQAGDFLFGRPPLVGVVPFGMEGELPA